MAEVDHLVATRVGPSAAVAVLRELAGGAYVLPALDDGDLVVAADVMERYGDQAIGVADASLVVLADRYATRRLLTLDRRHFEVVRAVDGAPFSSCRKVTRRPVRTAARWDADAFASVNASGRLGSYRPVSMAFTMWRVTPSCLRELRPGPGAVGAREARVVREEGVVRREGARARARCGCGTQTRVVAPGSGIALGGR